MLPEKKRQIWYILVVFVVIVLVDQATKAMIIAWLPNGRHIAADTFFYFTHQRNTGLVIGIFRDTPIIAYSAPLLATLVLAYLYRHLTPSSRIQSVAFGMVAGGAIGNLIDRFFRGSVVDFLQFNFYFIPDALGLPTKMYPAFNIADSAICVGVVLLSVMWYRVIPESSSHVPDPS